MIDPEYYDFREFVTELTKNLFGADTEITASDAFDKLLQQDIDGVDGRECFKVLVHYASYAGLYQTLAMPRFGGLTFRQAYAAKYMWRLLMSEISDEAIESDQAANFN